MIDAFSVKTAAILRGQTQCQWDKYEALRAYMGQHKQKAQDVIFIPILDLSCWKYC